MVEPSTVLVVDDEIGPRESLRAILKSEYQVLLATEGEQAIQMVEEAPVDVVLLDLRMPGISGIRVLERIKAIDSHIEVILITGYASYETVLEALRLHAFDYIPKPFDIPDLRDKVKRAVTRRHKTLPENFQEALHTIEEGSQILLSQCAQQLDEHGKETLRRVHAAAVTLVQSLQEAPL